MTFMIVSLHVLKVAEAQDRDIPPFQLRWEYSGHITAIGIS